MEHVRPFTHRETATIVCRLDKITCVHVGSGTQMGSRGHVLWSPTSLVPEETVRILVKGDARVHNDEY